MPGSGTSGRSVQSRRPSRRPQPPYRAARWPGALPGPPPGAYT